MRRLCGGIIELFTMPVLLKVINKVSLGTKMADRPARLICVDNDLIALDHLRMVLDEADAQVESEFYNSPAQAERAHRASPAELVICDLRLGAMTGFDLIQRMQTVAPDSIYMLLSGDADLESALIAMNQTQVFRFFTKPARTSEIKLGVYEAIRELNLRDLRAITSSTLAAIEQMNMAVASIDLEGRIIFANAPARV